MNVPDDTAIPELMQGAAMACVVIDGQGRLRDASHRAAALLGVDPAKLNGTHLRDIAADGWDWAVRNALLRLASGSVDRFDLLLRGANGRHLLIQMNPRRLPRSGAAQEYLLTWREPLDGVVGPALTGSEAELSQLAQGLLRAHESERGRVAAELHDEVAPLIAMAKFAVEDASRRLAHGAHHEATPILSGTVDYLRDVLAEVRRISTELRPSSLADLGLLPTLEWYCRVFAKSHPGLHIEAELRIDEASLDEGLKLDLFRIVEEALTNVARHAQASTVRVALVESMGRISLKVDDDGKGFDVQSLVRDARISRGIGLRCVSQRVDATRGTLVIESRPRRGTSIIASWPLAGIAPVVP